MAPSKTYLGSVAQWERTVQYLYFLYRTKWLEWQNWSEIYKLNLRWGIVPERSDEALRALWAQEREAGPHVDEEDRLCVVRASHRLVVAGDVLIASINNGMGLRYPIFGVSSKGARLSHYWLPVAAPDQKGLVDLVELPGDLINLRWDDPAIGRFVVDLRASRRRRVGAGSPAP